MLKEKRKNRLRISYEGKEIARKALDSFISVKSCLDEEENKEFILFLRSPYFNRDNNLVYLFQRLWTAESKASTSIQGKSLIKKLYKTDSVEVGLQKLTDSLRRLELLLIKYLSVEEAVQNPIQEQRLLISSLKKRRHTELFLQAAIELEMVLQGEPVTIMRLESEWWLNHQLYFHQNTQQYGQDVEWFEASNRKLDQFIQLVKLQYICEAHNRRNILNEDFKMDIPDDWIKFSSKEEDSIEVIWLYREIITLLRNGFNLAATRKFLYHFINKSKKLAVRDQVVLAKLLTNILFRGVNLSYSHGMSELMRLFKFIVKNDIYLFEGVISDDEFLNISIMSGASGEFKFQSYFLNTYGPKLEDSIRSKATNFAIVYRNFHLGKYRVVIEQLKNLFPSNTRDEDKYMYRAKALLLRAYLAYYLQGHYECYEEYARASDNFRHFITRNEMLNSRYYASYRNLIYFCDALVNICNTNQRSPSLLRQMQNKLDNLQPIVAYSWLREQILMLNPEGRTA